jgi:UDP-glucuronate 4-epimerase
MKVLLTGAAGFIGMHVAERLLSRGDTVVGLDNLNSYYDIRLKEARLARLTTQPGFTFQKASVEDRVAMDQAFSEYQPSHVVHLAGQAGVRHSLVDPHCYIDSNLMGFLNVLEGCRHHPVKHLVYASSSSVYGGNAATPFAEDQNVDHPVSLYAATKKANELMAHSYSHLFNIPTTGLRFFTVYGPWGRPDMALFLFTEAILAGRTINIFNQGELVRDFTYVDDIVEGVIRVLDKPATPDPDFDPLSPNPAVGVAPFRIFNIGNSEPTPLMRYVKAIESAVGLTAQKRFMPMQPGDVHITSADTSALEAWVGFKPSTTVQDGVQQFVDWYRQYHS